MLHYCVRVSAIDKAEATHVRFDSLLDVLRPSSYACHTGLTTGGGGVLPRSRYPHARADQRAAPGRYDPSLGGAIG